VNAGLLGILPPPEEERKGENASDSQDAGYTDFVNHEQKDCPLVGGDEL
jgi:hypothetical protein